MFLKSVQNCISFSCPFQVAVKNQLKLTGFNWVIIADTVLLSAYGVLSVSLAWLQSILPLLCQVKAIIIIIIILGTETCEIDFATCLKAHA